MQYSICSYSFNRMLKAGQMDIFQYIDWNKEHGFTQLDPWMAHLMEAKSDPAFLEKVKAAGEAAGLPFGCIAVDDKSHIYEETAEGRADNRSRAKQWIDIASYLGAPQVRIDAGGPEEMPDDVFVHIVAGYKDLVAYAKERNVEVIVENHWGPTKHPENTVKLLEAVDGLGLLFDTNNWAEGRQEEAWKMCARYASLTHIKTFEFDENGNDPSVNLSKAFEILKATGYDGAWGIESCPHDGDEVGGALKTLALIKRELGDL